jgi:hypothetical protein
MNRIQKKCNPVEGVGWGQVPTVTFQIGPRYRSVLFEVIATGAAGKIVTINDVLGDVVFKVNGNPQRTHSAWQMDQINRSFGAQYAYNVYNHDAGVLHFTGGTGVPDGPVAAKETIFYITAFFREPWRDSYAVADMFCWPTSWPDGSVLSSFTCELTVPPISINIVAGGTIQITCYTETDSMLGSVDAATKKPIMLINRWERQNAVYGGSGLLVISTLPKKDILSQISFFSAYAVPGGGVYVGPIPGNTAAKTLTDQNDTATPLFDAITSAKIEVDNVTIRDVSKAVSDTLLIDDNCNESALPPDRLDVVFDKSDRPDDGLVLQAGGNTVKDFTVTLNVVAGAANASKFVTILRQSFGPLAGGQ